MNAIFHVIFRSVPSRRPIRLFGLIAIIFFTVSGGAYGLEPVVAAVGGRTTLLLLVLVPLVWSFPTAMVVGELAATFPVAGGYYHWVKEALGEFWGFQEGWWSWLFTFVDMALYPVLCGDILSQTWPVLTGHALSEAGRLGFVLGFIWLAAIINGRGARTVSHYSILSMLLVLSPFVVLVARGLRIHHSLTPLHPHPLHLLTPGLGVALAAVLWNYTGWDNVATFAPEVEHPERTYPRALLLAIVMIAVCYLLPIAAGLRLDPVASHWRDGYFVQLGELAAGPGLALFMMLTATISGWAQYTSQLLYVLPLPASLAADGYLPRRLGKRDQRGVARSTLLLCTVIYSLFALASFGRLLVADMLLYSSALSLEFVALLALRRRRPELRSPFRIPLDGWRLALFCCAPMSLALLTLGLAIRKETEFTLLALAMVATGPLFYRLSGRWRPRTAAVGVDSMQTEG